jgi:hypothetical protein
MDARHAYSCPDLRCTTITPPRTHLEQSACARRCSRASRTRARPSTCGRAACCSTSCSSARTPSRTPPTGAPCLVFRVLCVVASLVISHVMCNACLALPQERAHRRAPLRGPHRQARRLCLPCCFLACVQCFALHCRHARQRMTFDPPINRLLTFDTVMPSAVFGMRCNAPCQGGQELCTVTSRSSAPTPLCVCRAALARWHLPTCLQRVPIASVTPAHHAVASCFHALCVRCCTAEVTQTFTSLSRLRQTAARVAVCLQSRELTRQSLRLRGLCSSASGGYLGVFV